MFYDIDKINLFYKNYSFVSFNEDEITPILLDFLENCKSAKRKTLCKDPKASLCLGYLDKELIKRTLNAYCLEIYFGTNLLSENLDNTEALVEILNEFANFIIHPYNSKMTKLASLGTLPCYA